ncbi:MAG: MFS transporter [Candidatus Liptonbacteria bacterium]|nr:MFS transporter [Candidatus Liptonbacteria bacterium]
MHQLSRSRRQAHIDHSALPRGVRLIAWARAVRWVGWGFGEALIPIFIFLFSNTFAEAGLLRSTYEIASLLSLPLIGIWADRVSAKRLILASLLLYVFVGGSYFLAGLFGLAIFIVIARGLNGFIWELENMGVETYYRRMSDHRHVAASFGYIDTWSTFAWIAAALAGMFLLSFMPLHYLLFMIVPFTILAYFVAVRAPKDAPRNSTAEKPSLLRSYRTALAEWRTWSGHFWLLGSLILFSGVVSALMWFFIPIDAYIAGANLPLVVLITVIGAIPSLFGYRLGKLADARNKYRLIAAGLISVALVASGLAVFPQYAFKLFASFLLGIILELFYVAQSSLITTMGSAETYGRRGSAFESVNVLGNLAAPLALGIGLDTLGFTSVVAIVAGTALVLGLCYASMKIKVHPTAPKN